jgi:hypothetical protein
MAAIKTIAQAIKDNDGQPARRCFVLPVGRSVQFLTAASFFGNRQAIGML